MIVPSIPGVLEKIETLNHFSKNSTVSPWTYPPDYWPFVRESTSDRWIPRTKGRWYTALVVSLLLVRICMWANTQVVSEIRRMNAHV